MKQSAQPSLTSQLLRALRWDDDQPPSPAQLEPILVAGLRVAVHEVDLIRLMQLGFDWVRQQEEEMRKAAVDAVNDYVRTKTQEDSFFRRIMPPLPVSGDELDVKVDTDKPILIAGSS